MKLCYFNYFLKADERILATFECKLKTVTAFQMIDEEGILVATNSRLIFCKLIGEHPHLLQSYEYKYITNLKFKEEDMYLYSKYNGDPIKLSNMKKDEMEKIIRIINQKDLNNILI